MPAGDTQALCCPRCCEELSVESSATAASPPPFDSWELDEQLRHIQRVLQTGESVDRVSDAVSGQKITRFDLPHGSLPDRHSPGTRPTKRPAAPPADRDTASSVFVWSFLLLGTMSFACGGILLGWSLLGGRPELWTIGVPAALVGQIVLWIGLVLQIDRLWFENRAAVTKLGNVDEQLSELRATATLLGAGQGSTAGVFYSHFAGGAGPKLLLTDLKSQLDLLALKIAQDER